jgi:serine/threonine protein kinase
MKAYSKGKDYFKRSVTQSEYRRHSGEKARGTVETGERTQRVGRYRILLDEELGTGYSCRVFKGVEEGKAMKRFAIKVIEVANFSSSCLQLFEREIEIHRQLRHDNIVRCHDVIKTPSHIYLVMEYCPHGDLATYIQQKKKLSEPNIVDIMTQIVSAYRYLAQLGILHRDLKPANVLRSGKVWKVADFGFAIRSGSFVDELNVGTPLYMPL